MSAIHRKYLDNLSSFRKAALANPYAINQQFLIELAGFNNLFELIDQMSISWFKQADKATREAVLDLALLLDSTRASRIFESALGANKKYLPAEHLQRAKELFIGFGQIDKAQSLGLKGIQKQDSENPFRFQQSSPESQIKWLSEFLSLGKHLQIEYTEDRFSHPVDCFEITNSRQKLKTDVTSVVVIAQKPGGELLRTVRSALASSVSPIQILVMQQLDTAEGYRTPIDVQRFGPNVKTVMVNEDLQLHQILNRALDESSGKYLCILNQGEILHPDALELLTKKAKKTPIAKAHKRFIGLGFELRNYSGPVAVINKQLAKNFGYFDHVRTGSMDGFLARLKPEKTISKTLCFSTLETPEDQLVIDSSRHYLGLQKAFIESQSRPFVTNSPIRDFYAPRPVRFGFKLSVNRRELNTIFALDLSNQSSLNSLREQLDSDQLTGIWDLNPFWGDRDPLIPKWLFDAMNSRSVQFVYPEERISTDKLVVLDPLALESQNPKRKPRWDVVDFEFDQDFKKSLKTLFPVSEV